MNSWTSDELKRIENAEELQVASLRSDSTLGNRVTIWVVRIGDDLYIRSYKGRGSGWFRGTLVRHQGHIRAGGVEKEVTFVEEANLNVMSKIDTAYRTKYSHYEASIVESMVTPEARAATLKLVPNG